MSGAFFILKMKKDINAILDSLAKAHNLTKINDKYYQGEYGTIFERTSFGYKVASILNEDYPEFKGEFFKGK